MAAGPAEAHYLYGTVLEQMGFVEKAKAAYARAARPDAVSAEMQAAPPRRRRRAAEPSSPTAEARVRPQQLLDEAYRVWEAGKPGSALRACEAALAADPDWAKAHNLRGLILDDMGHAEAAIAAYRKAVRLDPSFDDARRNLLEAGAALAESGEFSGLVVIRTFSFPTEAEIARGRLEAEGIPAVVIQGEIVAMNWLYSNMVGGVKLCVRQEDVEKALAVLDWDLAEEELEERCPQCGSTEVRYERYNLSFVYAIWLVSAFIFFSTTLGGFFWLSVRSTLWGMLLGFPLPVLRQTWTCRRCGHSWKDKDA